jgi:acetoin utilization deacetylase AcuC-like enzyme
VDPPLPPKGNGTARLFSAEPRVFTFSRHCAGNYFLKREASDRDVEILAGATDEPYVATLERELPSLSEAVQPQFVFFYIFLYFPIFPGVLGSARV